MAIASVSFAHRCWCIGGAMKLHSKKAAALLPISIWTYFSHLFGFHLLLGFCFSLSLLWSPPLFLSTTKYVVWIFQYIWNTRIKYIWNEPEKRHKNTKMQSLHLLLFVGLRLFSYKFVSICIYIFIVLLSSCLAPDWMIKVGTMDCILCRLDIGLDSFGFGHFTISVISCSIRSKLRLTCCMGEWVSVQLTHTQTLIHTKYVYGQKRDPHQMTVFVSFHISLQQFVAGFLLLSFIAIRLFCCVHVVVFFPLKFFFWYFYISFGCCVRFVFI